MSRGHHCSLKCCGTARCVDSSTVDVKGEWYQLWRNHIQFLALAFRQAPKDSTLMMIDTRVCVCMYVCMYVCVCVCVYVWVYVCVCVYRLYVYRHDM